MWFRPTLEVESDQTIRYSAVPERRTDRLAGHAATTPTASPNHASGHSTAMAARQSLDLAAPACALVSHSTPERPFRRHPVLLSTHRSADLEAIREGSAKELHDVLESLGVSVWFSEKDVLLGSSLLREIDKGLAKSRVGIVLVTPALLRRLAAEGIADKELSALLARDLLVPIIHDTTYESLREVSPLLGSRSGLSTAEDTFADIAAKLSELVAP